MEAGGNACDALVKAAFQRAAEVGQVPCVLAGDFNQDPLPSLSAASLALAGWRDLALKTPADAWWWKLYPEAE